LRGDSVAIFAGQLRHSGVVQADSATTSGGRVVLQASNEADIGGSVAASALGHGGSVLLTADKLTLKSPASIDVSHASGGGEILVGGGWQGQDPRIVNAQQVDVQRGVLLKADATVQGGGGTVVVWSEQATRFAGTILSRGAGGGSGGRVEVSGARSLDVRGTVDVIGLVPPGTSSDGKGKGGSGASGNGNSSGQNNNDGNGNGSGNGNANSDGRGDSDEGTGNGNGNAIAIGNTPASITTVALVPREAQPLAVQAALREAAAASEGFIQRTSATLQSAAPDPGDAAQRKVVVNETRCAVVMR
jgi:hypothetical protein